MADLVAKKEVSQDDIDAVRAWYKDPHWAATEEAPRHLGVKGAYDEATNAIVLAEPVKCNGEVVRELKL